MADTFDFPNKKKEYFESYVFVLVSAGSGDAVL